MSRNGRMSKNGKKPKDHRHSNMLQMSDHDTMALAEVVETRYLGLCQDYLRIKGDELQVPTHLHSDFIRWREMRVRHKKGDPRHSADEKKSLRTVAEWVLRVDCSLRDKEYIEMEWRD